MYASKIQSRHELNLPKCINKIIIIIKDYHVWNTPFSSLPILIILYYSFIWKMSTSYVLTLQSILMFVIQSLPSKPVSPSAVICLTTVCVYVAFLSSGALRLRIITWIDKVEEWVVRRQAVIPLKSSIRSPSGPLNGQNLWLQRPLSAIQTQKTHSTDALLIISFWLVCLGY